jgi:hypothetical protein
MPESGSSGSVRGAFSNERPYRDQKAAGDELKNQIVEAIHEPARRLRWALLMTADRGLRLMSRVLRA